MAVEVSAGQIVQVLVQGTLEGQQCENVWYFRAQNADPDMVTNLLADIALCLLSTVVPVLASTYTLERLVGKVVSPILGPEGEWIPAGTDAVQGAAAGDSEPSFVSALISLYTERGGRSGRGRIYFGGVPEGDTVSSLLNVEGPLWLALGAFLVCMLNKFKSRDVTAEGDYDWGVMSRKIGGTKPPFLATGYAQITRGQPRRELATTRSRKLGHGR
jgi:hypothetical protein